MNELMVPYFGVGDVVTEWRGERQRYITDIKVILGEYHYQIDGFLWCKGNTLRFKSLATEQTILKVKSILSEDEYNLGNVEDEK